MKAIKRRFHKVLERFKSLTLRRAYSERNDFISRLCRFFVIEKIIDAYYEDIFASELSAEVERDNYIEENHRLREQFESVENELAELKAKNKQMSWRLEQQQENMLAQVAKVLRQTSIMTPQELEGKCRWSIWETSDNKGYRLTTGYCMLGGCELRYVEFASKESALVYSFLLDAFGIKPSSNTACSECYAEYMKDCI